MSKEKKPLSITKLVLIKIVDVLEKVFQVPTYRNEKTSLRNCSQTFEGFNVVDIAAFL